MSLTAYAREVIANKAAGKPDPPAPASTVTDEVATAISEAQAALTEAGQSEAFRGDPYAIVLHGLSLVLGVFPRLVHRLERAGSEPRPVLTGEERIALHRELTDSVRAAALAGTKQSALGLARAIDRRFAGWIGAGLGAAFVLGCAVTLGVCMFSGIGRFSPDARSAAAWRDLQLANPDPTPALQQSRVAVQPGTGRRYYECVALWAAPAPPPRPR
jgi:hypothetical protein